MFVDIPVDLLKGFSRNELQRAIININHIVAIEVRKDIHDGIISHRIKTLNNNTYEITVGGLDLIVKLMTIHKLRMPDRR